eukprot:9372635-Pyramimonas_sp.AAC.1
MWSTSRTSFLARPLSTSGSTSQTRATWSRYQIRYRSGGGNKVLRPYKVVNGRPNHGTRTYRTTDAMRCRWQHPLRVQVLATPPQSHPKRTRSRWRHLLSTLRDRQPP